MVTIKNKIIPFGKYKAINIFGIVFYKGDPLTDTQKRHEYIHTLQMRDLLYIGFYPAYLIDWAIHGFKYDKISFEKEAYAHQDDPDYPKSRKIFAMWRK